MILIRSKHLLVLLRWNKMCHRNQFKEEKKNQPEFLVRNLVQLLQDAARCKKEHGKKRRDVHKKRKLPRGDPRLWEEACKRNSVGNNEILVNRENVVE